MIEKDFFEQSKELAPERGKNRIYLIFSLYVLSLFFILMKASYLQIFSREKLLNYSRTQIFREKTIFPNRGNILDRNGFPLAINIQTWSIFAIPRDFERQQDTLRKLSKIAPDLSFKSLQEKLHNRETYTWLARKIPLTEAQVEKIKDLKGVYIEPVPKRFYPNGELLSQTLGFVGLDNIGLAGIEYQFDGVLRGKAKKIKYLKDAKGRPFKFEADLVKDDSKDIILTIDKEIQSFAEKALKDGILEFSAEGGGIGVMDVNTGEIMAIANYPSFDPNYPSATNEEHRKLSFISDPFEPGSIFKTLTIVSALENKNARPDTNYYCENGQFKVDDHIIKEAEKDKKFEWLSVTEILKHSSNIGTTKIAFDVKFPRLLKTWKSFNIGEKTEIEIPGESRGILNDKDKITPLTLSNLSFGQGLATTGIQMLAAYAAIANGGFYIKPTIIKSEEVPNKVRIISKNTVNEIQKMLVAAVEDGTGTNAQIPYFKIAGKTSTAQRVAKNGGYEGYIPGFVGFPMNVENRFVIFVYILNPKGLNYFGNFVAAPIFKKVAKYLLYKNKEFNNLEELTLDKGAVIDSLKISDSATRIMGDNVVPNFIGLDKKSSAQLAEKLSLKLVHQGIGVVVSQSPNPKSEIGDLRTIKLIYSPPKYE